MKKRRQQEKKRKKRSFRMPEWSKMIHWSKKVEVKPPPTLVQRFTNALLVPEPSIAATIVTLAVFMLTGLYLWRRYVGVDRITQRMREIIELGNVFILSCSCCGRKLRPLPYLLTYLLAPKLTINPPSFSISSFRSSPKRDQPQEKPQTQQPIQQQQHQIHTPQTQTQIQQRTQSELVQDKAQTNDISGTMRSISSLDNDDDDQLQITSSHHVSPATNHPHSSRAGLPPLSIAMTCQPVGSSPMLCRSSLGGRDSMTILLEMNTIVEKRASMAGSTSSLGSSHLGLDEGSIHSTGSLMSFREKMSRSNSIGSCCSCDSFSTLGTQNGDGTAYLNIYFATQSGTSAYFAKQLLREGYSMGFNVVFNSVRSLSDAIMDDPASPEDAIRRCLVPLTTRSGKARGRVVFLVSTHHDGGPSDDAKDFVDILTSIQSTDCLTGLKYSVLGFGDSSYAKTYNMQGKLYDRVLNELGGKRLVTPGWIDAQKDIEYDVESWKWKVFWPKFADLSAKDCQILSTKESGEGSEEGPKLSKRKQARTADFFGPLSKHFDLKVVEPGSIRQCHDGGLGKIHPECRHLVMGMDCRVKSVKSLWKEPEAPEAQPGSIMHIEFDLTPSDDLASFRYSTGDNIAILPVNPAAMVEAVAAHLDYSLETVFMLYPKEAEKISDFQPKFPTPCTVREYLSLYAELGLPPRREVARALSKFATKPEEREELNSLSAKKNYLMYNAKIAKEHIGFGEMITKYYPSIQIPLVNFIELCAPLQPRWYSASSSSLMDANTMSATFFVVTMPRSIDDSNCYGVCSHYMANLGVGEAVRIIKMGSSGFIAPPSPTTPLIMVANGTGVAPMRALCQERYCQKTVLHMDVGPTHLFFGVRNRHSDFLFKEEFETYQESGSLTQVHLACSREYDEKVHVQHLVQQEEDRIWELLEQGGHLYVCGATAMGADIDVFLRLLVAKKLGRGMVDAYMETIAHEGRYIREGWTSKVEA